MLKKSYIYMLLTVAALLAAACSKAPELTEPSVPVPDMTNLITFDMLGTKVTNDDIKDQEFIIYDYVDGALYIDGNKYTLRYSESDGAWRFFDTSGNAVDFFWTETGTHEFFAYNKVNYYWYMYTGTSGYGKCDFSFLYDGVNSALSTTSIINMLYPTDGVAPKGYTQDLIYASESRNVESEDGFSPVSLEFAHAFSSVKITVRNESLVTKNIEDLMLASIKCNTGSGEQPTIAFSGEVSVVEGESGDYPSSDKTLAHGEEWVVFDSPVVVLPQKIDGAVHNIQWTENDDYKHIYISDFDQYWYSGRLYHYVITLKPTELVLVPDAEIQHVDDASGNKTSVVIVDLNAPDYELPRITDLVITVTDPQGAVCKTYEAATVDSSEIRMECDELLDPGTYTVSVEYNDGLGARSSIAYAVSEDTAVQPAVGYYVNSDGTFSETFVSGNSIAKIFWMGDPTEDDTKLGDMYPDCNRGLAYEVDPSTGNIKITTDAKSWNQTSSRQQMSTMDGDYGSYSSTENIHGYSNTMAIKQHYNQGFIGNGTESAAVANVTSSWYIPSVGEFKLIDKAVFGSTINVWTSTVGHYQSNAWAPHEYYACYIIVSTDSVQPSLYNSISGANGAYVYQPYFRILAF